MKTPLKEIFEELKRQNIDIKYYKVLNDFETGEHTLIIRTSSIGSVKYATDLENQLKEKFLAKYPDWDLIIIPLKVGKKKKLRKSKFKKHLKDIVTTVQVKEGKKAQFPIES